MNKALLSEIPNFFVLGDGRIRILCQGQQPRTFNSLDSLIRSRVHAIESCGAIIAENGGHTEALIEFLAALLQKDYDFRETLHHFLLVEVLATQERTLDDPSIRPYVTPPGQNELCALVGNIQDALSTKALNPNGMEKIGGGLIDAQALNDRKSMALAILRHLDLLIKKRIEYIQILVGLFSDLEKNIIKLKGSRLYSEKLREMILDWTEANSLRYRLLNSFIVDPYFAAARGVLKALGGADDIFNGSDVDRMQYDLSKKFEAAVQAVREAFPEPKPLKQKAKTPAA